MRVATIDIGTNTVLLLVAEASAGGELVALEERARITRLGEGVDETRSLAPAAIARTTAALDELADVVAHHGVARVAVVGTSAMRDAGGGEAIDAHVRARLGVSMRTITGDEEARLTFAGALSGIAGVAPGAPVRVFDVGGGSTEIVHGRRAARGGGSDVLYSRSFDVGSVRLTERHVKSDPPTPDELDLVRASARDAFAAVPAFDSDAPPIGIAGTMTTLAAVASRLSPYDGARVHGMTLTVEEIERVRDELARVPLAERRALPGLEPKRADVIVAGCIIALAYLERVGAERVTVSDRGLRWGLAERLASGGG